MNYLMQIIRKIKLKVKEGQQKVEVLQWSLGKNYKGTQEK